jgi:hypothetical protein
MKTIIAGGRDYQFTAMDETALDRIHADTPISIVICGGASGADECGKQWAISRGIPHEVIDAPWDDVADKPPHEIGWHPSGKPYWKQAGPFRNDLMAQKADALIIFPGGRGTRSMLSIAKRYDLTVFDIKTFLEHQE